MRAKAIAQLMCSFVLSQLDYYNSLLNDIRCDQVCLQKVQNHAANVFLQKQAWTRWTTVKGTSLAASKRKDNFQATFAVRFFYYGTLPPYLSPYLSVYTPSRTLRSSLEKEKKEKKKEKKK